MDEQQNPFVSIIVITYKSAQFVRETLNSVLTQTYKNFELIISDDCSPDNTIQIVTEWIESVKDKNLLLHTPKLVTAIQNKGTCANCNQGIAHAKGDWVKLIAGDDLLEPDCIETYIRAIYNGGDEKIMLSGLTPFQNDGKVLPTRIMPKNFREGTAKEQEIYLIKDLDLVSGGPTLFIHTETLKQLGGFDERFPLLEDYPIIMKFLHNNFRIKVLNEYKVRYRVYPESVSCGNPILYSSFFGAIDFYTIAAAYKHRMWHYAYHYWLNQLIRKKKYPTICLRIMRTFDLVNWKHKFQQKGILH